ncbi:sensor histidine kinase [Massilia brevitalea]|uniref:sensor histidine kinase n=1 Tax=Massilia brevitalea TaxID=442526 RepID=UPI00273A50FE|nr:sensor histidine kinase [Massilia brevitalea]
MNPSDAAPSAAELNKISRSFSSIRDSVFSEWMERVAKKIPEAALLDSPIILNTFPALFDNLVESLTPNYPRGLATAGTNLGAAHGRERANMTGYSPADLILEFQIFRQVIFDIANTEDIALSAKDCNIISQSVEAAIVDAIKSFTISHNEISETFIACLSHDLRNPLNIARVSSQMIQHKSSEEKVVTLAHRICTKLSEVDVMIQSLLDAAALNGRKKLRLHIISFDMTELVREVCADMSFSVPPTIPNQEPVIGFWCRVSMKRVLENLLANAQKYGDQNKTVSIHINRVDDRLLLSVHNEGRPIPEDQFESVFRSYHRLENFDIKGWGLGLPFVQIVAECHGGVVVVDSAEGRGTTFTISIPIDCREYGSN